MDGRMVKTFGVEQIIFFTIKPLSLARALLLQLIKALFFLLVIFKRIYKSYSQRLA